MNVSVDTGGELLAYNNYQLLDDEGFLIDPYDWDKAFSEVRAAEMSIVLSKEHWDLIALIRYKYLSIGALPSMRSVCRKVGFEKRVLKEQFGSCLVIWKLAGLPYPGEEAKTYMS